jgi:hypothetical protein
VILFVLYFLSSELHARDASGRRSNSSMEAYLDGYTGGPILLAGGVGLVIALGALAWFNRVCGPGSHGLCEMANRNPPWVVVTGLIAAPSALLTWYWRTAHKKSDISGAVTQLVTSRFSESVRLLESGGIATVGAIYALERLAHDSPADHWTIMRTLAAFVRHPDRNNDSDRVLSLQTAIIAIGRRSVANDPDNARVDLSGAGLSSIDFSNLNFANAIFTDASVEYVHFNGTDLRGAALGFAKDDAKSMRFDDATLVDKLGGLMLLMCGINEDESRRHAAEFDERVRKGLEK